MIVSRNDSDAAPRALVTYVPLTTQNRQSLYEVPISQVSFLDRQSVANVQGFASIPTVQLERRLGKLPDETFTQIKRALVFALNLGE